MLFFICDDITGSECGTAEDTDRDDDDYIQEDLRQSRHTVEVSNRKYLNSLFINDIIRKILVQFL